MSTGRGRDELNLHTGIPDLRLQDLALYSDGARGELDADGRLGVLAELIARETRENCIQSVRCPPYH